MRGLLNRYILRQLWAPALLGLLVISFIIISGSVRHEIEELLEEVSLVPITLADILRLALYAMPTLVVYILPVAFLMSVLLAFGRMAHYGETMAIRAAGIPLKRIVTPVVVLGAALSGACFLLQDWGQPWAYGRLTHLLSYEMPLRPTLDLLPTGVMHTFGDWRVYIRARDPDGALRDIVLLMPDEAGRAMSVYASSARLTEEEGTAYLIMSDCYMTRTDEGDNVTHTYAAETKRAAPVLKPRPPLKERRGQNLHALYTEHRLMTDKHARAPSSGAANALCKQRIEIGNRLSLPLMCLAVTFMAAPLGARARRSGRSYLFTSGFTIAAVYFMVHELLEPVTLQPLGMTILLGQIPNLLLCSLGGVLLWRVDRV